MNPASAVALFRNDRIAGDVTRESLEKSLSAANYLNRMEMSSVSQAWHYGAWVARENFGLSYTCFFPNSICGNVPILSRWIDLMQQRVQWVTHEMMGKF